MAVVVLLNLFPAIALAMPSKADQIVASAAQAIASAASAAAPVLTGELAGSISARPVGQGHWEVTAASDHAAYVEYGTAQHGAAQPYLTPAAHQQEPAFDAAMRGVIA